MRRRFVLALIGLYAAGGSALSGSASETDARSAKQYHVAPSGDDSNDGSQSLPLQTISAAALRAQPGDVITVHEGVYRERINPPRGGESDGKRIVYQAAAGEKVVIKGSEVVKGWEKVQNDTWKVTLPDSFFGEFNPFKDVIRGDWFSPRGRVHHTGAVYLDGHWLTEAARLEDVLEPAGDNPLWFTPSANASGVDFLLNVAWIVPGKPLDEAARIAADSYAAEHGIQTAACSEGGKCVGWINDGDWVRYEMVDFGRGTEQVEIRSASPDDGGLIELRLDKPDGQLLGTCAVAKTGDWQKWATFTAKIKPTSGKKALCLVFRPHDVDAQGDDDTTTIWAQFKGVDPNEADVEINVRQAVFYPDKPGVNFITVRGFTMMHAATPWAPPTAEQIGLIGTHWSKGWVIEDNDIRYSTCVGVTLGKHGDQWDNTSQNTATGYVETIERALENGWSKDNIGHHVVRNNTIAHCEQAGIVGSMGAVFCTVTGNTIHDVHVRRLFTGAEMAGIKIHGAIDTVISHNHIYRTCRGIWLDWMAQGTRVTGNLLHDNGPSEDLFVEVNHGPFLVDNNVLLSANSLRDWSQGGAYVHNLFVGGIALRPVLNRATPFYKPHTTEVAGLRNIAGGDDRFFNNLFVGPAGLSGYDKASLPVTMAGNVFVKGATPSKHESAPLVRSTFDPQIALRREQGVTYLQITVDKAWGAENRCTPVTTDRLGRAKTPDLAYEQPDGSPIRVDVDYFGNARAESSLVPGPFRLPDGGQQALKVWPVTARQ